MKQRNLILLALALGLGLVAAFLTAKLGASNKQEMVPVLVAAKNLDQGTKMDKPEELFVRKPFPKESVPPEFIDDVAQMKGKVLQRSVRAGTHVTIDDITPHIGVELPIDPKTGHRYKAMAIKASAESAGGGLILSGSRVDVITVERLPNGKTASTLILQNVLVVAVNDKSRRDENQDSVKNLATVTLAVKQNEGMILALAGKKGDISLMLRDPGDEFVNNKQKSINEYRDAEDNGSGNSGTVEMKKVPVATKTVAAGTKIEKPEEYFDEVEWPASRVPENAIEKMEDLRGKTITRDVFLNSFVFKEALDGEVKKAPVAVVEVPKDAKEGRMLVQYGANPPITHRFINGTLLTDGTPPQSTNSGSSPEIKPEEKEKEKDKEDK
jgi:pilus assembly protein CpaB